MRTTLTLDDDVMAMIRAEASSSGKSMKEVVNEHLRCGLRVQRKLRRAEAFSLRVKKLKLRDGQSYETLGGFLEQVEVPSGL